MSLKKQEKHKKMSFKRFLNSIKYSVDGLVNAYQNEQSLWLHAMCTIIIVILGFALQIKLYSMGDNCYSFSYSFSSRTFKYRN